MPCRLVALDLDGTILREDLSISPRVRGAIAAARERGVAVTLASGRPYASMRRWTGDLQIAAPVIAYQGAAIHDPSTHECLYRRTFPLALVPEVMDFAHRRGLAITFYADERIYVEEQRHDDEFYRRWFGLPIVHLRDIARELPAAPTKFIVIGLGPDLDALRPELEHAFGGHLQIVRSHTLFLEGLALGVTKGSALEWLAGRMGVAREDVMAIGDADNDRAMIAWAGLGVAMGNAPADVRAVAAHVAPRVEEDGAAVALERFCNCRQEVLAPWTPS